MAYEIPISAGRETLNYLDSLRTKIATVANRFEINLPIPLVPGTTELILVAYRKMVQKKALGASEKDALVLCVERLVDSYEEDVRAREKKRVEEGKQVRPAHRFTLTTSERSQMKNFVIYLLAKHTDEIHSGKYTRILEKVYDPHSLPNDPSA